MAAESPNVPLSHYLRVVARKLWLIFSFALLMGLIGAALAPDVPTVTARATVGLDVAWQDITTVRQESSDFFTPVGEQMAETRSGVTDITVELPANEQAANLEVVARGTDEAAVAQAVEDGVAALAEWSRTEAAEEVATTRQAITARILDLEGQIARLQAEIDAARVERDRLDALGDTPSVELERLGDFAFLTNLEVEQMVRQLAEFRRDLDRLAVEEALGAASVTQVTAVSVERGGIGQEPAQLAVAFAALAAFVASLAVLGAHHAFARLDSAEQVRVTDRHLQVVDLAYDWKLPEDFREGKMRSLAAQLGKNGSLLALVDLHDGADADRLGAQLARSDQQFRFSRRIAAGSVIGSAAAVLLPPNDVPGAQVLLTGLEQGSGAELATASHIVVVGVRRRDRLRSIRRWRQLLRDMNDAPQTLVIIDDVASAADVESLVFKHEDEAQVATLRP